MSRATVYNFTGGMPDPDSFPVEELIKASEAALRRVGGDTLVQYPGDKGHIALREIAAQRLADQYGVTVSPDDIAITNGSMQGLDLVFRAFVQPGDTVLVEHLCYMGTLNLLRHRRANLIGIPVDRQGMSVDALAKVLAALAKRNIRPRMIYTISVNQNPTGKNLTLERKQRLLELAEEYDTVIFEDECYADILFEAKPVTPIYGLGDSNRVVYIGSFSKVIGPGLRLGYIIAPPPLMETILAERWDAGTSALASVIVAEFLREHMWDHIERTNQIVRAKRDALMAALKKYLGPFARCEPPMGGLFAWVQLPVTTEMPRLIPMLEERGVRVSPGRIFDVQDRELPYVRFSYGYPSVEAIDPAIRIFAECVRQCQRR